MQQSSEIPLFIACNTESGGDNACGDSKLAYSLGRMANEEACAIGCNMAFAPVCDISYNWENTEIISRAFGNDPVKVAEMSVEYLKGAHTINGFACAAKHFPGNGLDFRDAHMSNNANSLSVRKWGATYGKVYKALFRNGLEAVMAGHIMFPDYERSVDRNIKDEDILPATLSRAVVTGLLRERLGFNGLVLTDATHMVGMTCRMKRSEMLPTAINAGCDMLLFFNDPDEDFHTLLNAYKSGVISEDRVNDALERILGLKAHMGLNKKTRGQLVPPPEKTMKLVLGKSEYTDAQKEISRKGITLVKYKDKNVLPITPERYKRIMTGSSAFVGKDPIDSFCGLFDARI